MAEGSGLWAIVILIMTVIVALYLFFEVLGFTPTTSGSAAAH